MKWIWLFLFLLFAVILLCGTALAQEEREILQCMNYSYALLEDGTAEITGWESDNSFMHSIPSELDGHTVTSIGDNVFSYYGELQTVFIPDTIVKIGYNSFAFCRNLKNLSIPESVTTIEGRAFAFCNALESVTIPEGVESIGDYAFSNCRSLMKVTLPKSLRKLGGNPFADCTSLSKIALSPDSEYFALIDNVLFSKKDKRLVTYPKSLSAESYTILQGICIIGEYAFSGCTFPKEIIIPDSVTSIEEGAFSFCVNLDSLFIPDSVSFIEDYVFLGCPDIVITVNRGSYAAEYCEKEQLNYSYKEDNSWLD